MGGIISPHTDNRAKGADDVIQIETRTLESLLIGQNAPREIDYLSIDIEGAEERVLGSFNFKDYQFNCITIERPSEMLRNLLRVHGYVLIKEIPRLDCFYVHRSFLDRYSANVSGFYSKTYLRLRWR